MPKSKRQLADEAWLRLNTPNEEGVLPGQLPLGDPPKVAASEPVFAEAPAKCPSCDRRMTLDHGWTPSTGGCYCLHLLDQHPDGSSCVSEGCRCLVYRPKPLTITCGFCGWAQLITEPAWRALREAIRERYLALNAQKPKPQPKRQRGAR